MQRDQDRADRILALRHALARLLDAVRHAVAQQVFERGRHPVQHTAVHLDGAAADVQLDLLAGLLGGQADHPVQAV
jgi:hypothetical protein